MSWDPFNRQCLPCLGFQNLNSVGTTNVYLVLEARRIGFQPPAVSQQRRKLALGAGSVTPTTACTTPITAKVQDHFGLGDLFFEDENTSAALT